MSVKPVVSIIVPVYNVQKYIGRCLKSLVRQTFDDIEIIVVDDGSPDESYKAYEKYAAKDSRVRIIKQVNKGVSEARNTGIENASGKFIVFVDSDDWMEEDACEILIRAQEESNADLVVADVYSVVGNIRRRKRVFDQGFVTDDKDFIKQYQAACLGYGYNPRPGNSKNINGLGSPWNKLFSTSIIQENQLRFDSYVNGIFDDNLFTLYYLSHVKNVCYVSSPVYDYRILPDSLTQSYKKNTLETSRRIFEKIELFIKTMNEPDFFRKPYYMYVIRRFSTELGVYYFAGKNRKELIKSMSELKRELKKEPYRSAIGGVDVCRLMMPHKLTWFGARIGSPVFLYLQFRIRRLVKRIIKK